MTERFARERVRHELARRSLRVLRIERPAPGFVRVALGGEALDGFAAPGPADHVKLVFPDGTGGTLMRDYTPLVFALDSPGGPELVIDFYLHGGEAGGGPASRWAAEAEPGDELVVAGPRGSALAPGDIDELIVVADESALPSVTRWLDTVGAETPATVYLALEDERHGAYLDRAAAPNRAFHRFPASTAAAAILQALRDRRITEGTFVFLAGEATALVPLRRYLRRELSLPKAQVDAHGYWKRGTAGHDHHAPIDETDPDD